ncbi:hypothetical protein CRUP_031164 [Coryphaenoides rupestris]|nr:hypothetical protein CRUP_031164 [Coryphaenoides rupestris]
MTAAPPPPPTAAVVVVCLLLLLAAAEGIPSIPPHDAVARVARFVANQCTWASVATISTQESVRGQPFSNAFSVSDGEPGNGSGVPYMYLTRMEISVKDLQGLDPQSPLCAHIILSGSVLEVNDTAEAEFAKKWLFWRHPEMKDWPSDHDWFFAKFNITKVWRRGYMG